VTVRIVPGSAAEEAVWRTTREVAAMFHDWPWVLIGAQMVIVLELEHGRPSGRTTGDVDVVVDVRVVAGVTRLAAERLGTAGFEPTAEHPHRFVRGGELVDLLAPDHLGPRTDLTTIPPLTTIGIPGGSRALETRRAVAVEIVGVGRGDLPIPSLAGALAMKVRAYHARRTDRDLEDIVRLLGLVDDVEAVRGNLKPRERSRLGSISAIRDEDHPAWSVLLDPDDARAALGRLAD
jgi:predicted nucleotidyltransferase